MSRANTVIFAAFLLLLPLMSRASGNTLGDELIEDTEYIDRSIEEIAASSDVIVTGTIVKTMSVERDNDLVKTSYNQQARIKFVLATLEVDGVLRGGVRKDQQLRLVFPASARIAGEPVYDLEQQGVWFLRRSAKRGEYLADHPNRLQPLGNIDQIRRIVSAMKTTSANGSSKKDGSSNNGSKKQPKKK